ncbi:hypothetical protein CERSUDRAFT_112785 [Gelatoporia subvermispora B]|uniref:RED-like N-terminal domain-containing protein n=1 Tax=Ceriporiopsis subvermispora (strain B) TaxID=914234 RepID=M2R3J0_CERS8|nr:hypothetical protein CERSUDRAFT_112785 [Gelatoporia subvermispora B]
MDQDSFRKLLQTPRAPAGGTPTRLATSTSKSKAKAVGAGQPAFKPRTIKKKAADAGPYRDRASERRLGVNNDYAEVEAIAEDFERRAASTADPKTIEEQRQYLGGDSTHTVLVKGLDLSLLEQSRARLAASTAVEEDESLELAFREAAAPSASSPTVTDTSASAPRKRTREEILAAIKNKRAKTGDKADTTPEPVVLKGADVALEEAKKAGKFRPIGFKPIGGEKKVKKVKAKEKGEKKRKADAKPGGEQPLTMSAQAAEAAASATPEAGPSKPPAAKAPEPELEPLDESFDIFADAGDYTGVDIGDDDESSESDREMRAEEQEEGEERPDAQAPAPRVRWVDVEEDDRASPPKAGSVPSELAPKPSKSQSRSPPPAEVRARPPDEQYSDGEEEEERPMRLQPLASSAIPSIRDLLEADKAADKSQKWRDKKGKKKQEKGEGKPEVDKNKLDRDYKRLKAYTDKKARKET